MIKKPKVNLNCAANRYAGSNERIIEFTFPNGEGGLITFFVDSNGKNHVDVYRVDPGVYVRGNKQKEG